GGEELAAVARVLAAHDVGRTEGGGGTRRQVAQVPDRRGNHDKSSRHCRISRTSPGRRRQRSNAPVSASITQRAFGRGKPSGFGGIVTVSSTTRSRVQKATSMANFIASVCTEFEPRMSSAPSIPSRPSKP